jgi:hypothetical protein
MPARPVRCYASKSQALRAFADRNRALIDRWGGLSLEASPAEFDAINHKYDLRGKRQVRTLEQALFAALPDPCLDRIDLAALNATSPASEAPFELPDHVIDAAQRREERAHRREEKARLREERDEPFTLFGRQAPTRGTLALGALTLAGLGLVAIAIGGRP